MIDLHTHTIYSDGILTVNELVNNAINNNVEVLSITDHDTIDGVSEYQKKYLKKDILFVSGVEFSTDTYYLGKKTKIHLLGYGYKVDDNSIKNVLYNLYNRRYNDNMEYIDALLKKFSFLSTTYFEGFNYGKYGWLYKYIINYVSDYLSNEQLEYLKDYLVNNKPHYNKYNESVEDMIALIHSCDGYSVFAHPQKCDVTSKELDILVKYLNNLGLDGLETYHIESNQENRKQIHKLALKYNLYETGGSDFHSFQYSTGVGDLNINFPKNYDYSFVKRLIKEKKVLGGSSER